MDLRCIHTSIFIKTPSLEGLPSKAKEDFSPHEMGLSPAGHQASIFWSWGLLLLLLLSSLLLLSLLSLIILLALILVPIIIYIFLLFRLVKRQIHYFQNKYVLLK